MGFFSPWFLAGAAVVGLPLWLHLLRRHRSEPLKFSSLMFFEARTQSSIKHRRLRYLVLLSLRIAMLLLLALAFAQPWISRLPPPPGSGRKLLVIAVDDSFSMRQANALDRAKQGALDLVSGMHTGDQAQIVSLGSQAHLLTQPNQDPQALRPAVQSIQPGDERSSFAELARAARSITQASRLPVEVHLFSDMQRSSLPPAFADLRMPAEARLILHPLADTRRPNWAVESVKAPTRLFYPKKARVQATVAGYGTGAARRTVSLVVNDKVLESKQVDVPAGGRATVEFVSLDAPHGRDRGEIRMEPHDQFPEDDRFYFSVERTDPSRILFVHEARSPRSVVYFNNALDSASEAAFVVEPATTDQIANVSLAKYSSVVLSDVAAMPESFLQALAAYVRGGGSVFIALGPVAATRPRVPIFDEAVLDSRYSARSGERFQTVAYLDPAHPSFRRANRWEGVKFYQAIRIDPGKSRVLARLADETPILLEKKLGEGRVLVFASTLDNISNDFPLHAAFLPFVEQTVRYLSGDEDRLSSLPVDANIELRSARDQRTAVEVLGPDGRRALSLADAVNAQNFLMTQQGFYEVRRGNGRNELIAVNPDRRESELDVVPKETLALWEGTGRSAPAQQAWQSETERKPWSLGWYLLLALLGVAVIESIVAARHMQLESGAE